MKPQQEFRCINSLRNKLYTWNSYERNKSCHEPHNGYIMEFIAMIISPLQFTAMEIYQIYTRNHMIISAIWDKFIRVH